MSTKKSYFDLIKEAIVALKDRTGSSAVAIKGHIVANNADFNFQQVLSFCSIFENFKLRDEISFFVDLLHSISSELP